MGMHLVDRNVGSRSPCWSILLPLGLDLLRVLLAPDRPTEFDRAKSRFHFFKFHRRNSSASARAASVGVTERDGTEPPPSECSTPLPAGQENVSVAGFLKPSTRGAVHGSSTSRPCLSSRSGAHCIDQEPIQFLDEVEEGSLKRKRSASPSVPVSSRTPAQRPAGR